MDQRARVRTRPVGAPDDIELGPTVVQLGPQGGGVHCRHQAASTAMIAAITA